MRRPPELIIIYYFYIQAEDDPIAPKEAIPFQALKGNPNCTLVVTPTGGHLGWCTSDGDGIRGAPWSDKAVIEYLNAVMKLISESKGNNQVQELAGVYTMGNTQHQAP